MKRALLGTIALLGLGAASGCQTLGPTCASGCGDGGGGVGCDPASPDSCQSCAADPTHPRLKALKRAIHGPPAGEGMYGPPSAAIAYPYYSVRGPRDYFEPSPSTIGR
jgi:hypothetical protein